MEFANTICLKVRNMDNLFTKFSPRTVEFFLSQSVPFYSMCSYSSTAYVQRDMMNNLLSYGQEGIFCEQHPPEHVRLPDLSNNSEQIQNDPTNI